MAVYCGVDIIEIERLKNSLENTGNAFKNKVFTENEILYCESRKKAKYQSYAARFAAKEAVSKAFGTGIGEGFKWRDIEVKNDALGRPCVILGEKALQKFRNMKGKAISLSLSHCKTYAVACAILETEN